MAEPKQKLYTEAEMEALIEAVLAKRDEAKAEAEAEISKEDQAKQDAYEAWLNEKVPYKAFRDGDTYKDDIFVAVNGERYQIKRGKTVMIPRKVLLVLQGAEEQLNASNDYAEQQIIVD